MGLFISVRLKNRNSSVNQVAVNKEITSVLFCVSVHLGLFNRLLTSSGVTPVQ